jgi:hypothetical protein
MKVEARSAAVINWFWSVGHQRQGRYVLGTGTWLDKAYDLQVSSETVAAAQATNRRCMALWGPSQAGKSTLLSRYFDSRSSASTTSTPHSALQWSPLEPVVFLGHEDTPPNCVQLNPYNQGTDASGCVSRFVLKDAVDDPVHPVQLRLCTQPQVLHSLAAGFLSECSQRVGQAPETFFDGQTIEELLSRYASIPPRPINRAAYERLRTVADLLEDLATAGWPRYLKLSTIWETLRLQILTHPALLSDPALVDDFASKLFWNGEENLTSLFGRLRQTRDSIQTLVGTKSILCSLRVAKLFLNISSYQDCLTKSAQEAEFEVRYSTDDSCILLDHTAPNHLFSSPTDFGLWQGLAWELVFPVKAGTIAQSAPQAHAFLKETDLQDFPGVALAMPGGVKKAASDMTPEDLLTLVLKRGKTASVVAHRARELGIDSFCLLIRMCTPPAQPDQLIHGIKTWLNAIDLPLPPPARDVPLNLVLTFGAKVVNDEVFAIHNKRPNGNFENVFSWLDQLGPLTAPGWPAYFATTYPQWPEGLIIGEPSEVEAAYQNIAQHPAFTSRFGQQSDSLRAMFLGGDDPKGDGGVGLLLDKLIQQARQSRMPKLLAQREKDHQDLLQALLNEALPLDDFEQRKSELQAWKTAIKDGIGSIRKREPETDAAVRVSILLRQLLNVDPKLLELAPLHCANTDVTPYIGRQFNARWLQSRRCHPNGWSSIGLKDQASTERLLGYLCEYALRDGSIAQWIRRDLGQLAHREEADYARRFLATKMGDALCFGTSGRKPHRQFAPPPGTTDIDSVASRLAAYAASEAHSGLDRKEEDSPHYKGFIAGFVEHLDRVANTAGGDRPPQPGDDELRRLRSEA